MTLVEFNRLLSRVKYKEGWDIYSGLMGNGFFIQWVPDKSRQSKTPKSRKWYISRTSSISEILNVLLDAILLIEQNSARENFTVDDKNIYNYEPSLDVLLKTHEESPHRRNR